MLYVTFNCHNILNYSSNVCDEIEIKLTTIDSYIFPIQGL